MASHARRDGTGRNSGNDGRGRNSGDTDRHCLVNDIVYCTYLRPFVAMSPAHLWCARGGFQATRKPLRYATDYLTLTVVVGLYYKEVGQGD